MNYKITIFTSDDLQDFVRDSVTDLRSDCDYNIVVYKDFSHLSELYREHEEDSDAFILSDKGALEALLNMNPDHSKPLRSLEANSNRLKHSVDVLLNSIELERVKENLPVAIIVSKRGTHLEYKSIPAYVLRGATRIKIGSSYYSQEDFSESEELIDFMDKLREALINIKANTARDIILKEDINSFHLYTSVSNLEMLTGGRQHDQLSFILEDEYDLACSIGYGIGTTISEAENNARTAHRESVIHEGTFIFDEDQVLTGPIGNSQRIDIKYKTSEDMIRLSETCKLSTVTIQRLRGILSACNSNLVTASQLAELLDVSVRNANRIITRLEAGNAAKFVYERKQPSKGRPVKVFEILLD